jgi:branched-chain amino acid transport system substrate-binding protein
MTRATVSAVSLLGAFLLPSCTLTRKAEQSCTKTSDCRATFGVGYVCAADGLCERAPPNPRCTTTFPQDLLIRPESYPNAIMIGSLADWSVETQRGREDAIRLAVSQVNEERGLDGRPFGVVFCDISKNPQYDSLARVDAAVASARYLANVLGVPAIVGPSASGDALAVFDATRDEGVLLVSPAASSPELTGRDEPAPSDERPGLLWRTAAPDTIQGQAIARWLIEQRPVYDAVVVVHEKGPYGDALASVFTDAYQKSGRKVTTLSFETASQRDAAVLQAPTTKPPFVLFFSSQTQDAVAFLNAASTLPAYQSIHFFLTDSAANPDLLSGAAGSSALPRVVGSRPALPQGQTFELFRASYSAAFRKDASALSFVPHAYDAAWMAFYGAAWSLRREGAITGLGMARGLRKLSVPGPEVAVTPGNWGQIVEMLSSGAGVNLVGASGTLDFDPATEETTGLIDIWKVSADGKGIESTMVIDPR